MPEPCVSMRHVCPGMTATSSADTGGERSDVDVSHRELVALHSGEQVDVVDQPRHAVKLRDADVAHGLDVERILRVHHLQMAAHDRDGGLELMAHVVEQLTLHADGALQPVEHRVDRAGEVGDVVVPLLRDAGPELRQGDGVGRSRACAGWGEEPPDDEPPDDADCEERPQRRDRERDHREGHRLQLRAQVDRADVEALRRVAGHADGHGDVAQRPRCR